MQIDRPGPPGLAVITPPRFGDARGWFSETWNAARMRAEGLDHDFVQDNHSLSGEAGTLRGMHYQSPPFAQTKLVRCTRGAVWDAVVDIRQASPTYLHSFGVRLDAEAGTQLLAPRGFLHGFLTLTPDAEVQYKVDNFYSREHDGCVAWNDPDLGLEWPLAEAGIAAPVLSDKDAAAPRLRDIVNSFIY